MNKVIIIGLGAWGTNFLRIIKNLPSKYKLVGLVDPLLDSRNSHNFLSLENFLKSNIDFDAAIITTPATTHFEITKKLLTLKKHCLVEKPLTTSSKESFELYEIAKKNKVKLLVDHTFLYDPAFK